jgi:hypothetical protein
VTPSRFKAYLLVERDGGRVVRANLEFESDQLSPEASAMSEQILVLSRLC